MKKCLFLSFLLTLPFFSFAKSSLERVEPAFWWVGMQNPELQLLVHGQDISSCEVALDYQGVELEEVIRVQNPNYLFINLKIAPSTLAGTFTLAFKKKNKVVHTFDYVLRSRDPNSRNREGFNTTDVMYLVTPDRFANGNPENDEIEGLREGKNRSLAGGRHGGDIQGLVNSLDYISAMGFTAIWLNPVLENDMPEYSYHGYAATDFYKVDPRYGSNDEYLQLSLKAKEKGIKLIMDMIVNHCGSEHWWMRDLPTKDWINNKGEFMQTSHIHEANVDPYVSDYDKFRNNDGWFVESMPDLNQRNHLLATYLIQNTIWWIEYAHLDGIRMDTWPYPDKTFMNQWCEAVLAEYPHFNMVGEEWTTKPALVAYWQKGQHNHDGYHCALPSLMDFPMQEAIVKGVMGSGRDTYLTLAMDFLYPDPDNLVVFVDNHDMSRVFTQVNEDFAAYQRAIAYLTILRGIPQIYYGTEILMSNPGTGDHGVIRSDFPGGWEGDTVNAFTGEGLSDWQKQAQKEMKHLLNWRKGKSVIHYGQTKQFAPLYDEKVYSMARYDEKDLVLLIMNNSEQEQVVDLSRFEELTQGISSMTNVMDASLVNFSSGQLKLKAGAFLLLEK